MSDVLCSGKCLHKAVCGRRRLLWILLVFILICIVLQTFVTREVKQGPSVDLFHFAENSEMQDYLLGNFQYGPAHTLKPGLTSVEVNQDTAKTPNHFSTTRESKATVTKPRHMSSSQTSSFWSSPGKCTAKTHIVFLKTHKTASSTILNILQLFYPHFFASHFVQGVSTRRISEFHIMCNHMRFKKSEVAKVMPRDTFYFSILRNPVRMMESIFSYYKSIPAFHNKRTLDDFFNTSKTHYISSLTNNHYAHNILAFDFGLDNNATFDSSDLEQQVSNAISAIERDFHLILISEYFDESMVLLRHVLCWSLEDVVSFKLNSRSDRTRRKLSPETAERIKKWNVLDWQIYLHFNATFWHKLDTMIGRQQVQKEVNELRKLQTTLSNLCLKDGGAVDPSKVQDQSLRPLQYGAAVIQGYNLNPDLNNQTRVMCERLITPELQYTAKLYNQQFPDLVEWLQSSWHVKRAVKRRAVHLKSPQSALSSRNKSTAP
ncbi:hypothetical protein WMY93_015386 [Mugilogobius chulae]|uniref:Galactose-3-O-sulfotransferase 2 n=1 Tax=Mugilogobius chulae TaxID=88201 RepID=A0AAW0NUL1_9GOBI